MSKPITQQTAPVVLIFVRILILACGALLDSTCLADVCVLANRTRRSIDVSVTPIGAPPYSVRIASGEVQTLYGDRGLGVAILTSGGSRHYQLPPNSAAYLAATNQGQVLLRQIGLGENDSTAVGRDLPGEAQPRSATLLDVMLLVDEDEPHRRPVWEKRLRDRVARASQQLIRSTGIGLRVVGVGTWRSDNATTDFVKSLGEFESEVAAPGARLAIGFTSQYEARRGRLHMGGTRGPLRRHILLREWSGRVSETERLELLLHELGHFLAATHSPEQDSIMRPVLGDGQARRKGFAVRFDPVNTLIMAMVAEEVRRRDVQSFGELTYGTKQRLAQIYKVLGQTMPEDPSTKHFERISKVPTRRPTRVPIGLPTTPAGATRQVLRAIVATARAERQRPAAERAQGDKLTERYVQAAAAAATGLPAEQSRPAFLLALGIALDDSMLLQTLPQTKKLTLAAESLAERKERLAIYGTPTVDGRADLTKHFFVSAHLATAIDSATADKMGIAKETIDAQIKSGFSFPDIAANRAGVRFAESVLSGRLSLAQLATNFRVLSFTPSIEGLSEGLKTAEFVEAFGGVGDERFERQLKEINRRIDNLPPYMVLDISF